MTKDRSAQSDKDDFITFLSDELLYWSLAKPEERAAAVQVTNACLGELGNIFDTL